MERLQKVMAQAGIASRRRSEEMILQGRVTVNGLVIQELGCKVNPRIDVIKVDDELLFKESFGYYLFNKPTGVLTSVCDPHGRKVVLDFFSDIRERIYPVGRLDKDTSGLLLLTNDGDLTHKLMHPSFHIKKVYQVEVKGIPSEDKLQLLREGVKLEDGMTAPAEVHCVGTSQHAEAAILKICIHEGRNRQVRRMCKHIGHLVVKLHRERYDFLTLEGLSPGSYRALSSAEIKRLKEAVSSHKIQK